MSFLMAYMYPQYLLETKSAAERELYKLFQVQLSDEYSVFHSVAWLARGNDSRAYDGEADFLIAHPTLGVLVLEVKGGRLEYNGIRGIWTTTDRYGDAHQLKKDPFIQAKDARYQLWRKLANTGLTASYNYRVCHAVAFPDVTCPHDIRPDAPAAIVIDQRHLTDLEQAIRRIFAHWGANPSQPGPGHAGIKALVSLLAPTIELNSYLGSELKLEAEQIKRLTEEQFVLLTTLSRNRRALINGCAGSGKTMLALEKARRLAQEGYSVLFTCFNARLAEWLNTLPYRRDGITITHFHKLCVDMAKRAKVTIPPLHSDVVEGDEEFFFGEILPDVLMQATEKLGPQFDAVIVDEGQDFHDAWWIALETLLRDPANAVFYIFSDDNQNIYAGAEQKYPFQEPSFPLTQNCRNTRHIHNAVVRYYRGDQPINARGPEGRPPVYLSPLPNGEWLSILRRQLHKLVVEESVPTSEIIVLSPRSASTSRIKEGESLGNFVLTWKRPISPNQIECSTIHSFKGLERSIIVLVEVDQMSNEDRDKLLYVGMSRAVHHIIVIGNLLMS
jgi:hypothetical protein